MTGPRDVRGDRRPDLNPAQREAVEHGEGPLLVLAGAGSGKTRVLTARVARLVETGDVPPRRILAVTFTNRAAGEMRERIAGLLGREPAGLWALTFHALGARILRREADLLERDRAFTIYDRDDSLRVVKDAMAEAEMDPERWPPASLLRRISEAKSALVDPEACASESFDPISRRVAEVYPLYERRLRRSNAYDFDDLLTATVRLLEGVEAVRERHADRFLHVLVDEYQDTNHAQYRMVRALASRHGNVCVVGDDDQSIYGWRGADLGNILDFERDFPGARVVRLERNYRSTGSILRVANEVIARNRDRKPKELRSSRDDGEPVRVVGVADEKAEARWTVRRIRELAGRYGPGDVAVLYRTNAQSRPYEEALRRAALPYRVVGGVRFYERREIRDVVAYLQLVVNPADDAAFLRAARWPRRGIGNVTLERLREERDPEASLLATARGASGLSSLPAAGARALAEFAAKIEVLHAERREAPAAELLSRVLETFGLREALEKEEDGEDRLRNLDELVAGVLDFEPSEVEEAARLEEFGELELFLQHVSLLSEIDESAVGGPEGARGAVSLMTLHNAKGLEFPVVFVGGLERGLFPLARAEASREEYEEERRLFYVGVTRARDLLHLTHADRRWRAGSGRAMRPSPFLEELPEGPVERRRAGAGAASASAGRATPAGMPRGGGAGGTRLGRGRRDRSAFGWTRDFSGPRAGGEAGDDGERQAVRYDYSDSQVTLELEPGARLAHPRFGPGTVVSVSGRGEGTKVEIDFDEVGRRKVAVAFGDLRPV